MLKSAELNKIFPLRKMAPECYCKFRPTQIHFLSLFFFFLINKTQLNWKEGFRGWFVTEHTIYHLKSHQLVVSVFQEVIKK